MTQCYPLVNPPLPYGYGALEPYIDEKTMCLHHDRHLQGYIDKLNGLLLDYSCLQNCSLTALLQNCGKLPKSVRTSILNNAGGVFNHQFFFEGMAPCSKTLPKTALYQRICKDFGSFEAFQEAFRKEALSVFGSGYAWLVLERGCLRIVQTANQVTPCLPLQTPILNLDVWEHAYYLKHFNLRRDYISDWFSVINWEKANQRYLDAV